MKGNLKLIPVNKENLPVNGNVFNIFPKMGITNFYELLTEYTRKEMRKVRGMGCLFVSK